MKFLRSEATARILCEFFNFREIAIRKEKKTVLNKKVTKQQKRSVNGDWACLYNNKRHS